MPEQQTMNPPVNSNSGSSSSQDTNQSTPKVDDTIDELVQGEDKKKKRKSLTDSLLEAAKKRDMGIRGISQKDLDEGRVPESVRHLYTLSADELFNPNKALDFVNQGAKFLKKEKDTMLAGPDMGPVDDDNIIYEGMQVDTGEREKTGKKIYAGGGGPDSWIDETVPIKETKYQITHDDPTYIKDYFFRTGKHPAQDPDSGWTQDERNAGKQSWQREEYEKEYADRRAKEKADPAIMEAEEWLGSKEGVDAKTAIRDEWQVKIDALLDHQDANKY